MNIVQQTIVITGGASGIGYACAKHFHKLGLRVVVWDREISASSEAAWATLSCDVTREEDVEQALHKTLEQCGVPRILINCAGIAPAKKLVGREGPMPLDFFSNVIAVNLIGTFNVMRLVARAMSQAELPTGGEERGVIINTASIAAYEGQIGQVAYSAAKGGIVSMTLPAARELAAHAIRVNTIAPGLIATPLMAGMSQEVQDSLANTVIWPKRLGFPDEFAALSQHLIENTYINGEIIRLDGALRMQAR